MNDYTLNFKNKNCLVTGGAGFIGGHLVDCLIEMGWQVISIDDLSAIPTNLEEIFLKIVSDSNASDNQTS